MILFLNVQYRIKRRSAFVFIKYLIFSNRRYGISGCRDNFIDIQRILTHHIHSRKAIYSMIGLSSLRTDRCISINFSIRLFNLSKRNSGKRSEEHTSELQSRPHLVCRLLLEKKKKKKK